MRPRTRHVPALVLLTLAGALLPAAPGAAAGWSPTQSFAVGKGFEPVPRAAIAADGTSALAWQSKSGRLMLTTGRGGRFGAPRQIDRAGVRDWSVAAKPDGAFIVVWEDRDGIRAAVRTRSGRPVAVRRVTTSNGEEINGVQVAADPLGGWVVAERQFRRTRDRFYHVRAMTLSAAGRLAGAVQELGPGEFGIDARPTQALAVGPDGRAVLAFVREARYSQTAPAPTVMVATRPPGRAFGTPVALPGDIAADPRVGVGAGGRALIAATQARSRGDAGVFGDPVVARLGAAGALANPFGPALAHPRRAFAPSAAFAGDVAVLVFALKPAPQPFETEAPVRAVAIGADGRAGELQTLTSARAKEPVVMGLAGARALAMWSGRRGLGAALAGRDGIFHKTAEPKGPPPDPYHTNSTNRDLRTAGRFAIFTWAREGDGRVRVSVRGF